MVGRLQESFDVSGAEKCFSSLRVETSSVVAQRCGEIREDCIHDAQGARGERRTSVTSRRMTAICRICQCGSDEHECNEVEEGLIRACGCEGTQAHTHKRCLEAWIGRRLSSGSAISSATVCEICGVRYKHRVVGAPVTKFLFASDGMKRWLHVAYVWFMGRRLVFEMGCFVRWMGRIGGGGKAAFSALMAVHYCAFLVLDAKLLVEEFRRWRAKNVKVEVCDRDEGVGGEGGGAS